LISEALLQTTVCLCCNSKTYAPYFSAQTDHNQAMNENYKKLNKIVYVYL